MLHTIQHLLTSQEIGLFAPLPMQDCHILRPYLLERVGITEGTVIMMAVPYVSTLHIERNLSLYATVKDYHLYFDRLFAHILPVLREQFPAHRFAGFADHSPIDEVDAAARAGLGVRGDHGLLLTREYSSFVFLGEIITDAILPAVSAIPGECLHCGACCQKCPVGLDKSRCLSALTQKKSALTAQEEQMLDSHPLIWGCDTCQLACPYTAEALRRGTLGQTPPFFREDILAQLSEQHLEEMDDETFRRRAYAWRGRNVILRNIRRKQNHT